MIFFFFFFKLWYHAKILRQVNKLLAMQRTIQAIETQARNEKKQKNMAIKKQPNPQLLSEVKRNRLCFLC